MLIGALCFGYFLTIDPDAADKSRIPHRAWHRPYGVLVLILLMYLVLGCLMDAMAMVILTVPIVFPVVTALGFDPIWFGVVIVMTVELGLDPSAGRHERVRHQERDQGVSAWRRSSAACCRSSRPIWCGWSLLILFPLIATWLPQRMMG